MLETQSGQDELKCMAGVSARRPEPSKALLSSLLEVQGAQEAQKCSLGLSGGILQEADVHGRRFVHGKVGADFSDGRTHLESVSGES